MALARSAPATRPRAVVVGSVNQDLVIKADHLPIEGETLQGHELVSSPGGKGGNQAVAVSRLGVSVAIVARVGHDAVGVELCQRLEAEGVSSSFVLPTRQTPTGVAMIVVRPDGENTITVAGGANHELTARDVMAAEGPIREAEALLLQLEVPVATSLAAVALAHAAGAVVSLNAAPLPQAIDEELLQLIAKVDILVVNAVEAAQLLGLDRLGASSRERIAAVEALQELGPAVCVITLGREGGVARYRDRMLTFSSIPVEAVDGVGAGDAFCAGLVIATIEGRSPSDALEWAAACGGLAATDVGAQASLPFRHDVEAHIELSRLIPMPTDDD